MDMIQLELNTAIKIPACGYSQSCVAPAAFFALLIRRGDGMFAPTVLWACQVHKPAMVAVLEKLTKGAS
jgi:hypothetical protein